MKRLFLSVSLIVALLAIAACNEDDSPTGISRRTTTERVNEFVVAADLPKYQYASQILGTPSLEFFFAVYGEAQDCPAGCSYSRGYGVRLGSRVGWMEVFDEDGIYEVLLDGFFDVRVTDSELFDLQVWDELNAADDIAYSRALLPMLAKDADTSREALLGIAELLYSLPSYQLSQYLVQNATVASDEDVLVALCGLPVFDGFDIYANARARAVELLAALRSGGHRITTLTTASSRQGRLTRPVQCTGRANQPRG